MSKLDCLVIGAGAAGLTAGLYLRRFWREALVLDGGPSRAAQIPVSHNYPGFPAGIPGTELLARLRGQLAEIGAQVVAGHVDALERDGAGGFVAHVGHETMLARTVLLATGMVDHQPEVRGVAALRASGLLRQCPICDGFEFSGKRIGIIGAGRHGVREATFLRNYTDQLYYIAAADAGHPGDLVAALQARHIHCIAGQVQDAAPLHGDRGVQVTLDDGTSHCFDVLYAALGATPQSALARALGAEADEQDALTVDGHCETSVTGLYAAGDVVSGLDQLAVAAGQAAIAATAIHNALRAGRPS